MHLDRYLDFDIDVVERSDPPASSTPIRTSAPAATRIGRRHGSRWTWAGALLAAVALATAGAAARVYRPASGRVEPERWQLRDEAVALLARQDWSSAETRSRAPSFCEAWGQNRLELGTAASALAAADPAGPDPPDAIGRIAEAHPELLWPRWLLARALAARGRTDDAVAVLDRVLLVDPQHQAALEMKSELLAPPPPRPVQAVPVPRVAPPPRKPGLLPRKPVSH